MVSSIFIYLEMTQSPVFVPVLIFQGSAWPAVAAIFAQEISFVKLGFRDPLRFVKPDRLSTSFVTPVHASSKEHCVWASSRVTNLFPPSSLPSELTVPRPTAMYVFLTGPLKGTLDVISPEINVIFPNTWVSAITLICFVLHVVTPSINNPPVMVALLVPPTTFCLKSWHFKINGFLRININM